MIFKAVKSDESVPRCLAFIKRLLQMSYLNEANFTAASLLIISEILKARTDIKMKMFPLDFLAAAGTANDPKEKSQAAVKLDQA